MERSVPNERVSEQKEKTYDLVGFSALEDPDERQSEALVDQPPQILQPKTGKAYISDTESPKFIAT